MNATHLIEAIDQLRGACPELDLIADGLEGLATRRYQLDLRQTVVARLAGSEDDDTVTVIGLLVHHLCTTGTDLHDLNDHDRKTAERYGQDTALHLTDPALHRPASEASAAIDPTAI